MKKGLKNILFPVLFFSALWGFSEAVLGGYLYNTYIPLASVPLTLIAIVVLTVAKVYLPFIGSATLVAAFAMLYKFLNLPFFACHLLGILILGMSYDICFDFFKIKYPAIKALATCYLSYIVFAILITYIFRYDHWLSGGMVKIAKYIFIEGSFTAVCSAVIIPLVMKGVALKDVSIKARWLVPQLISYACWLFAVGMFIKAMT